MSRLVRLVPAVLLLAACGDNRSPEGGGPDAPAADASGGTDGLPAGCDYVEQRDATNDDVAPATGTPEDTGLELGARSVICGAFEHTHFDGDITIDIDSYTFTVTGDTGALVRISGAATGIELVGVDIYTGPNLDMLVGAVTFYGDHGVTNVRLPAGTYALTAFALHLEAITATVPYQLEVVTDMPDIRCPELAAGGYAEANDGGNNRGNDVITLPDGMPPRLTASTMDAPEPSGLVLAPDAPSRFTGTAANIAGPDLYEDKDTYLFATDATTNELSVRLTWPGNGTNLDYFLFEENNPDPVVRATRTATQAPELETFSVKPSTSYWLLVGARAGTTVPAAYTATLCGDAFAH